MKQQEHLPARLWWVLFPPFELFPEGGLPRSDRVRKRLAAVARVLERPLYVAVFAVLFVVVVTRLFD